jgi:hypothetical protein
MDKAHLEISDEFHSCDRSMTDFGFFSTSVLSTPTTLTKGHGTNVDVITTDIETINAERTAATTVL